MSGSNTAMDTGRRPSPVALFVCVLLALAAVGVSAFAVYKGQAPIRSPFPEDWIIWARGTTMWAAALAGGMILLVFGLIGALRSLFSRPKSVQMNRHARATEIEMNAAPAIDIATATRASESRGNLRFNAQNVAAAEPVIAPVQSLEPAIYADSAAFSDNASDSFMTRQPEVPVVAAAVPAFDSRAALSEAHGLHINGVPAEQLTAEAPKVVPLHAPVPVPVHDPLEAALLAETPDVITQAPQGDINAVINSTMRFAPQSEIMAEAAPVAYSPITDVRAEVVTDVMPAPVEGPVFDDQAEIRQAVQTALSVWPDATRAIAADELSVRIAHLYYDKSPAAQRAFHQIASGDLSAAASALAAHADSLALAGNHAEAAEQWRISGALHMGRDDGKAMAAYEHVSELDPNDANIHLYLARRYQMAGETAKQPAVIGRALGVISDPVARAELLAPFADLKLKAGDAKAAGDAFEELSRLHETTAYLKPDDVGARSAHAITLARFAQAREMQGAFDQAGPLYKKAHQVFADLSAMKPEHPGLRAMADNALKDAQRFNMA